MGRVGTGSASTSAPRFVGQVHLYEVSFPECVVEQSGAGFYSSDCDDTPGKGKRIPI